MKKDFRTLEERVECLEDRIEGRIDEALANKAVGGSVVDAMGSSMSGGEGQMSRKDENYWRARRSLRIWPILGTTDSVRVALVDFLVKRLKMDSSIAIDVDDCVVRRVPTTKSSKVEGEVIVEFPTIALRDAVRGSAYNLAGQAGAGIRLEVPNHLMNNFRALNQAGYRLKQKFPKFRRNVKFDDEVCNLMMEFRTSENEAWNRLRPEQARLMEGPSKVRDMTVNDMTALLSRGEDDRATDEDSEEEAA